MVRHERSNWRLVAVSLGLVASLAMVGSARADLVSGSGNKKAGCYLEMNVKGVTNPGSTGNQVKGNKTILCTDGEPCDQGACGDHMCVFSVAACINQTDPNLPQCTRPTGLQQVKVKSKGSALVNIAVPALLTGSGCGAFVDGTLTIPLKKNGKPKKIPVEKFSLQAKAVKGTKPGSAKGQVVFKCLLRTTPCPPTTTTSTTTATTATTSSSTTTSTTLPVPTSALAFTTVTGSTSCGGAGLVPAAASPFSGQLFSDTGMTTPISGFSLGLGCLYIGGGNATSVPPDKIPDGATSFLSLSGGNLGASPGTGPPDCTLGALATKHCVGATNFGNSCTTDVNCQASLPGSCAPDAQCYFGPPLPIPNGGLSTCVLNVIKDNVTGTIDTSTGSSSINLPLFSRVYLTGNNSAPCPLCVSNKCQLGANAGAGCTPIGSVGTTLECLPLPAQFLAPLVVDLSPLTSGSRSMTAADGNFCAQPNVGAFGSTAAKAIVENGTPAGNLTDNLPHNSVLASTFCIPMTGNIAIDIAADLPGPGSIGLNGNAQLH
jgi:hypothetical protein